VHQALVHVVHWVGLRLSIVLAACYCAMVQAEVARVAVAANFASTAQVLAERFGASSEHSVELTVGSTGLLYAQIRQGAPFDVLLAADRARPERLILDGLGDPHSLFVYAQGRLAFWMPNHNPIPVFNDFLATSNGSLSLANPKLAPYGAAAMDIIDAQVTESQSTKLVYGENVAGAFALVASGNAQAGLVALSQLLDQDVPERYFRVIPSSSHRAIDQAAVLTHRGMANSAATAFLAFLDSQSSRTLIEQAGYTVLSQRLD